MKIGVISDTHDHFPGIDWAHQVLIKECVDAICHCGDWVAPFIYDAIFTGHTHQYRNEVRGKTLILNPGSLIPARLSKPSGVVSLAIYDTTSNTATHHSINVD